MLNGKNKVKGLYKDNTLVATWDKQMDPSDLSKAIANHVKENSLTEVDSDVEHVQSFPELLVPKGTVVALESVVEPVVTPVVTPVVVVEPVVEPVVVTEKSRDDMTPAEKRADTLARKATISE